MRSSGSSSAARFWAACSALLALASCGGDPPAPPGETAEYREWRKGVGIAGLGGIGTVTGGVAKVKLSVALQGFPVAASNDQWVELAVNGTVVHRWSLYSASGRPVVMRHETEVPQGILQVKCFDTGTNRGYSLTTRTDQGLTFVIRKGGPDGVAINQSR